MDSIKGFLLKCQEILVSCGQIAWKYLSDPWIIGTIAVIILVVVVIYLLSKRQPSRIRAFTNGSGYVEISRAALVDIIRAKSEQVDIEKKPGVAIRSRRGKLHVDVKIRLLPSRRLTEVSEILQQHLKDALQEGLGIRKLGSINVMVVGVRVKSGKEVRKSLPLNPRKTEADPESESAAVEVVSEKKYEEPRSKRSSKPEVEPESIVSSVQTTPVVVKAETEVSSEPIVSTELENAETETIKRENGTV